MAVAPFYCSKKANHITIYENQCSIARHSTAESPLAGDCILKGLARCKGAHHHTRINLLMCAFYRTPKWI